MLYTLTMIDNMFVISPVPIVLSATKCSVLVTRLKRQECVFIIYFYIHTLYYNNNITYYFTPHVDHEISEFPTVDRQHNLVVRLDRV